MTDDNRGADGAHRNSIWYKIMTEGTPEQQAQLRKKMHEDQADRIALERWAESGFSSDSAADLGDVVEEEGVDIDE